MPRVWMAVLTRSARGSAVAVAAVSAVVLMVADAWDGRPVQAATPLPAVQGPDPDVLRDVIRNGEAGFVVSEIAYALGPDGKDGACPAGLNGGLRALMEAFKATPAGALKPSETPQAYEKRLEISVSTAPGGQNLCLNPEAGAADPNWRMVSGKDVRAEGIDLDGRKSASGGRPASGTCAHDDFQGASGGQGIDNQFYRVVGCTHGFQSTGLANSWQIEMHTGSFGMVVSVRGIDDPRNDKDVEVGIFANADPIQLSAGRTPLAFATYAIDQDQRYRATTRGRIVDGVLTIDPVDVRFHNVVNSMIDDRVLLGARLRLTFTSDGGMEGYLAGYTPVESMYDLQFGARHSKTAKGDLAAARQRINTSVGRAGALGYSCNGAYHALYAAADGNRDPATGRCTSISTQYRIRLAPAFVVDARTQSVNAPLAPS